MNRIFVFFALITASAALLANELDESGQTAKWITWDKLPFAKALPDSIVRHDQLKIEAGSRTVQEVQLLPTPLLSHELKRVSFEVMVKGEQGTDKVVRLVATPKGDDWEIVEVWGMHTPREIVDLYLETIRKGDRRVYEIIVAEDARYGEPDDDPERQNLDLSLERETLDDMKNIRIKETHRENTRAEFTLTYYDEEKEFDYEREFVLERTPRGWVIADGF